MDTLDDLLGMAVQLSRVALSLCWTSMMWSCNSFFRFLPGIIVEQTMTERWVVIIQVVYETDPLL
jgi:hypothetical protein